MGKASLSERLGRLLALAAVVCLLVALLCLVSPSLRRRSALGLVGERTVSELRAFSTAVSYYSGNELARLASEPKADQSYKSIAGLLAQVRQRNDYKAMYILFRGQNRQYQYLIDANYRDNASAGSDFYAPATAYPLDVYRHSQRQLDELYSGKSTASYLPELIKRRDHTEVLCVYLPLYGPGNTVLAVLGVECDPGNTGYQRVGPIDLWVVGGLTLPLGLIFAILALLLARHQRTKAQRMASATMPAPAPLLTAAPPPSTEEETPAQQEAPHEE